MGCVPRGSGLGPPDRPSARGRPAGRIVGGNKVTGSGRGAGGVGGGKGGGGGGGGAGMRPGGRRLAATGPAGTCGSGPGGSAGARMCDPGEAPVPGRGGAFDG